MKKKVLAAGFAALLILPFHKANTIDNTQFWMKIKATDKFQRSLIADMGVSIEATREDFIVAIGNLEEKNEIEKMGLLETSFPLTSLHDFPTEDREFHNFTELSEALEQMKNENSDILTVSSIGKTVEGRDILAIRISGDMNQASQKPGTIFMGGHHSREHLSVEMPLRFAQKLIAEYRKGNERIVNLINNRDIHIIPAVNPDGLEYDVAGGRYKYWRKNRSQNKNGTFGVDLNRNYGFGWGTGGSSTSPGSDVYMGPSPFSEPETQAIKKYVETHTNISILLSFHTFSELILYPWGHVYNPISEAKDKAVHETMARTMAQWNRYTPQQSSELYIASGDTTDWSYGEHKIISFTFELDPADSWSGGGFYPGQGVIPGVVEKNTEPCLYLIEHSDNPYRVLDKSPSQI
ncbi:MAG: carboxypeptidase T [Oligoflexia bacterium]|nr:MAG: carboxypeptidase T [Oligoflexia bacterium]